MYRTLNAEKIIDTAQKVHRRVAARFPDAGLAKVAAEVCVVAREGHDRCRTFRRPNLALRVSTILLLILGIAGLVFVFSRVRFTSGMWQVEHFMEEFNALLGSLVFIGGGAIFLMTMENRVKRNRALQAITELRAMAHIVDMHQFTKDPETILARGTDADGYTGRRMTAFELSRYLDYCSELLSLLAKIGALYVQGFPDPVALGAVDEVEDLTSGLSREIWQKIMLLDRFRAGES